MGPGSRTASGVGEESPTPTSPTERLTCEGTTMSFVVPELSPSCNHGGEVPWPPPPGDPVGAGGRSKGPDLVEALLPLPQAADRTGPEARRGLVGGRRDLAAPPRRPADDRPRARLRGDLPRVLRGPVRRAHPPPLPGAGARDPALGGGAEAARLPGHGELPGLVAVRHVRRHDDAGGDGLARHGGVPHGGGVLPRHPADPAVDRDARLGRDAPRPRGAAGDVPPLPRALQADDPRPGTRPGSWSRARPRPTWPSRATSRAIPS